MANNCSNCLVISGPKSSLDKIRDELRHSEEDPISFEKHVPLPDDGSDAWGAGDVVGCDSYLEEYLGDFSKPHLQYTFVTAWSPPCKWLEAVTAMFPELTFNMIYEEHGSNFYGVSHGEKGVFTDEQLTLSEYLIRNDEAYPYFVKDVESLSQEKLIEYFSGVKNFKSCCQSGEEWCESLKEELGWRDVSMFDYFPLAEVVIGQIKDVNLMLFLTVDWGDSNKLFNERLVKSNICVCEIQDPNRFHVTALKKNSLGECDVIRLATVDLYAGITVDGQRMLMEKIRDTIKEFIVSQIDDEEFDGFRKPFPTTNERL